MLLHPSGGLNYHLRAWRWRHTLWQPFHGEVARWLDAWRPEASHLVLIGPSGGYALNARFLARFQRITVLEPDVLARHLLRQRFADIEFEFADSAWLAAPDGGLSVKDAQRLSTLPSPACGGGAGGEGERAWLSCSGVSPKAMPVNLAQHYPAAAFLFCNLLGQMLVGQGRGHDRQAWLAGLQSALRGRAWASWHDLASTTRQPDRYGRLALDCAEPLDTLLARFWLGGVLEIHDHQTSGMLPGSPRQYAIWQLAPRSFHLVEWLVSTQLGIQE